MKKLLMVSGQHDERRGCHDCKHMEAEVSWWCRSKEAIDARGTSIPGCIGCRFWEPCARLEDIGWKARIFGDWVRFEGVT